MSQFFNPEKRPPTDHVCHTFHHNLTTKTPHPNPQNSQKPQQKPQLPLLIPHLKKTAPNSTIETADAPPLPPPTSFSPCRPDVATTSRPGGVATSTTVETSERGSRL